MDSIQSDSFLNIFFKWIDSYKEISTAETMPIDYDIDVVDLTLILQAIGFRLEFFDFENQSPCDQLDDLNVEIKCRKSGIRSKLSYKINNCSCPEKYNLNNNSFWEVQGRCPKTPASTITIQESSSNLLPEVPKQCVVLSKAVISALFRYYRETIKMPDIKSPIITPSSISRVIDKFNSHVKQNDDKHISDDLSKVKNTVADILQLVKTDQDTSKLYAEIKTPFSTPLSSINVTPINHPSLHSPIKIPKIVINQSKCNTPPAEGNLNSQTIDKVEFSSPEISIKDNRNNLFTSSPWNATNNENTIQMENSKDLNVIQAITEARQKLDTALLFMRLNLTQDITSSIIGMSSPSTTPKMNPINLTPAAPINNNNKRHSITNLPRNQQVNANSALSMSFKAKAIANFATHQSHHKQMAPPTNLPLQLQKSSIFASKSDTPRPILPSAKVKAISNAINSDEKKLLVKSIKRAPMTSILLNKPTVTKSQSSKSLLRAPITKK